MKVRKKEEEYWRCKLFNLITKPKIKEKKKFYPKKIFKKHLLITNDVSSNFSH